MVNVYEDECGVCIWRDVEREGSVVYVERDREVESED